MEIEQVISYETKEGIKFKIRFSLFNTVGIPDIGIPIVDVVLISHDNSEIKMRKNRIQISPQEYRNKIFNILSDRKIDSSLDKRTFHIKDDKYGDHYITVISRSKNQTELTRILHEMNNLLK